MTLEYTSLTLARAALGRVSRNRVSIDAINEPSLRLSSQARSQLYHPRTGRYLEAAFQPSDLINDKWWNAAQFKSKDKASTINWLPIGTLAIAKRGTPRGGRAPAVWRIVTKNGSDTWTDGVVTIQVSPNGNRVGNKIVSIDGCSWTILGSTIVLPIVADTTFEEQKEKLLNEW